MNNITIERENVTKFQMLQPLLNSCIFLIHCHLNYASTDFASTDKSKLSGLYRHQRHV